MRDIFGRGVRIRTGGLLRPRQARYQAALRPDMNCLFIIKHFPAPDPRPQHFGFWLYQNVSEIFQCQSCLTESIGVLVPWVDCPPNERFTAVRLQDRAPCNLAARLPVAGVYSVSEFILVSALAFTWRRACSGLLVRNEQSCPVPFRIPRES